MKIRYIFVMIILCLAVGATHLRRDPQLPAARNFNTFPKVIGHWKMRANHIFSEPVLKLLRPTDYILRSYADDAGRVIDLYVGYHDGGEKSGPIHSPRNCLPGSGWFPLGNALLSMDLPGGGLELARAVYAKDSREVTFYYWYQLKGQTMAGDFAMKMAELKNALLYSRRDAAFVRINISGLPQAQADEAAADFISGLYPALKAYLPG